MLLSSTSNRPTSAAPQLHKLHLQHRGVGYAWDVAIKVTEVTDYNIFKYLELMFEVRSRNSF